MTAPAGGPAHHDMAGPRCLDGLRPLVPDVGPAELATLDELLATLADREYGDVVDASRLRRGVYRVSFDREPLRSLVVKRLPAARATVEHLVTDRWLPEAGLRPCGPPRLAVVPDPGGLHAWHVYEDLGAHGLDRPDVDRAQVESAVSVVADIHSRFSRHTLLPEARFACGDLGAFFYTRSVRDAIRTLDLLGTPAAALSPAQAAVRDGLLECLHSLHDDEADRVGQLTRSGLPETLLHGDLTRANVFVVPADGDDRVRLIDWDHAGVGPAAFDLSTLLSYFPPDDRDWVLACYLDALGERDCRFDPGTDWDRLLKTLEAGRLANQVIWLGIEARNGDGWPFAALEDRRRLLVGLLGGRATGADPGRAFGYGAGPWNRTGASVADEPGPPDTSST